MENSGLKSYFHKVGDVPLTSFTLGNLLETVASKYSNRDMIISREQNRKVTYKQVLEEADKFAAGLCNLGMVKGDRLGLWCPNTVEWVIVNMACARAGFITVALNPYYQAPELEYCINKTSIKVIVCPYETKYQQYLKIITELIPEMELKDLKKWSGSRIPSLEHIILISEVKIQGTHSYDYIQNLANETDIKIISSNQSLIGIDDACYIMFSSGTTGQPKAITSTHFQAVNCSLQSGKRYSLDIEYHIMCMQVPLFHVFGSLVGLVVALSYGSTLVLPSIKYSPLANLKALSQEKCSFILGTPTMYNDLINIQKQMNEEIKAKIALIGGAPHNSEIVKQIKSVLKLKQVKSIYGMTETSGAIFTSLPNEGDLIYSSVGQLMDHLEAKLIDEAGNMVGMGLPGELCIRGYSTFLEFWNDKEATAKTIDNNNWMKTGDKVIFLENRYAQVVGRIKDMINRGGENIYPKEIEDYLVTHPSLRDVKVVGIPDQRLGEEVCVCVILENSSNITLDDIKNYCIGKLAFSKIPKQLFILNKFPQTDSGKVQKFKLVEQITQKLNCFNGSLAN